MKASYDSELLPFPLGTTQASLGSVQKYGELAP